MFKQGDKVELIKIKEADKDVGLYIGIQGVCQEHDDIPFVEWSNNKSWPVSDDRIKLVEEAPKEPIPKKITSRKIINLRIT